MCRPSDRNYDWCVRLFTGGSGAEERLGVGGGDAGRGLNVNGDMKQQSDAVSLRNKGGSLEG